MIHVFIKTLKNIYLNSNLNSLELYTIKYSVTLVTFQRFSRYVTIVSTVMDSADIEYSIVAEISIRQCNLKPFLVATQYPIVGYCCGIIIT